MSFREILQNQTNDWADIFVHNIVCNSVTAATGTDSGATATVSVGFTGPFSASGTFYLARQGNIVSANFTGLAAATGITGYFNAAAGSIPAGFRPLHTLLLPYSVTSGNTGAIGILVMNTDGSLEFAANGDSDPFVPGSCAVATGSVTYNIVGTA